MANLVYRDYDNLLKNNYYFALSSTAASNPTHLPPSHTGIADSGASGIYFASNAPVANLNYLAPAVGVPVANGLPVSAVASPSLCFNRLRANILELSAFDFNKPMCATKPHFWIHGHVPHHVFCG